MNILKNIKNEFEELSGGLSGKKVYKKGNKIYKQVVKEQISFDIIRKIQPKYCPVFYGKQGDFNVLQYIRGSVDTNYDFFGYKTRKKMLNILFKMYQKAKIIYGKTIIHGDISPFNVVFSYKFKQIKGFIDWDHCRFDEIYYDIMYIFIMWGNILSNKKPESYKIKVLNKVYKYVLKKEPQFNPSKLNEYVLDFLDYSKKNLKTNIYKSSTEIKKWHEDCTKWWIKNFKKITT
ncbi:hypothetical protein SHELI_v1c04970 [Spiroplasma helicoides]|uniref:Aminoglycoside phosphotransferase domain-containing protein n=1 Tax=Spiroplasma helicoides TaxID=216938 RepID=A0A1B3SKI5_9MOLU|nr:phosphotransferase [Spiroplasma helicoides]AOG60448.1 hypothetical protein SHELI_v1c04970 [Spiroplasma helicoides]